MADLAVVDARGVHLDHLAREHGHPIGDCGRPASPRHAARHGDRRCAATIGALHAIVTERSGAAIAMARIRARLAGPLVFNIALVPALFCITWLVFRRRSCSAKGRRRRVRPLSGSAQRPDRRDTGDPRDRRRVRPLSGEHSPRSGPLSRIRQSAVRAWLGMSRLGTSAASGSCRFHTRTTLGQRSRRQESATQATDERSRPGTASDRARLSASRVATASESGPP